MDKALPSILLTTAGIQKQPEQQQVLLANPPPALDDRSGSAIYLSALGEDAVGQNPYKPARVAETINYDYSSKTNIMIVALTDFCPYFCSTADLNGCQLKDLKKREIMSPFNVHFNLTHMIELVRKGATSQEALQTLIFRKFKKTEVSLDWTLLKLSFNDLQIFK